MKFLNKFLNRETPSQEIDVSESFNDAHANSQLPTTQKYSELRAYLQQSKVSLKTKLIIKYDILELPTITNSIKILKKLPYNTKQSVNPSSKATSTKLNISLPTSEIMVLQSLMNYYKNTFNFDGLVKKYQERDGLTSEEAQKTVLSGLSVITDKTYASFYQQASHKLIDAKISEGNIQKYILWRFANLEESTTILMSDMNTLQIDDFITNTSLETFKQNMTPTQEDAPVKLFTSEHIDNIALN